MLPSRLLLVRQQFPDRRLSDVRAETRQQLERSGFAARLKPGARVAVGVGSRGIANIDTITTSVVQYWRDHGMAPFVFPAMGSHGAATPEGQVDVLAHLGVTEHVLGCPIVSRADVVSLGTTEDGVDVFMDAAAHDADAVMAVGRVKWHTNFDGGIESGLMKMIAIGMGKFAGAQKYHTHAQRLGLEHVIRTAARCALRSGKILGGLAIVEDAYHHTATIDAVPAECLEQREEQHLAKAKSWMPRLPCDVDVLIVDEMGKNISGTGMDAKVVNRGPSCEYNAWPGLPTVRRIFVRSLHPQTYGNAVGIGMADVTTERLVRQIDWQPTRINALSSGMPSRIRVPAHFATDRECLAWVAATSGKIDPTEVMFGWIRNTLALDRVAVSHNLSSHLHQSGVALDGEIDVQWDSDANLISPFG
jgi:Lactate racemase N-terminal domain